MARGAAVLLGAYGCEPHQLSPIDFEDKSGPDKTRSTGLLWHILWGAWWHPGFPCPAAGGLSEIKRILAAQTTSGRRPISLKYFRWICLSFHGFISFHFDTHLHTWHTFAAWLFTRFFEFSGFPVFFMFIYSIYIYIYMQIPLSAKEAVHSFTLLRVYIRLVERFAANWVVGCRAAILKNNSAQSCLQPPQQPRNRKLAKTQRVECKNPTRVGFEWIWNEWNIWVTLDYCYECELGVIMSQDES